MERFVLERFGQTDHARSDLLTTHSSTPDDEKRDFPLEVSRSLEFRSSPVLAPLNTFSGAFNFAVILVPPEGGERETGNGEEDFNHVRKGKHGLRSEQEAVSRTR